MITPSCQRVAESIASGEFYQAAGLRRIRLWLHWCVCYACRRYRKQIETIERGAAIAFKFERATEVREAFKKKLAARLQV